MTPLPLQAPWLNHPVWTRSRQTHPVRNGSEQKHSDHFVRTLLLALPHPRALPCSETGKQDFLTEKHIQYYFPSQSRLGSPVISKFRHSLILGISGRSCSPTLP